MKRAGVVLTDDGKILLVQHTKNNETYYVLPGGHVEDGETEEQAAIREVKEECNLDIEITKRLAIGVFAKRNEDNIFFLGKILGGELTNDNDPDKMHGVITGIEWIGLSAIAVMDFRPKQFMTWLLEHDDIEITELKDFGEY